MNRLTGQHNKPFCLLRTTSLLRILVFVLSFSGFICLTTKTANALYVKATMPLYVETFAGFFKGVGGGAPSGVANFPNGLGSITVSGTAGSSTLSVNSINIGAVSNYGGTWAAIIDFGDGSYQVLNATNVTANSIDIYPTLSRTVSSVTMSNLHDSVLGQHLSSVGYEALAKYVYTYDKRTAVKNRYAEIRGYAGSYFTTSWQYGAQIGTQFSLTGGLTNGGFLGFITKGITNCNCILTTPNGKPFTGADRTGYYSNGDVRTSIGGNTTGQGATKTAALGGKSGFFESFVGVDGQSQDATLPGRARAQLWIDGALVYDQTFSSLTRIAVPFENATTSTFTVTLADDIATSIGIGQTTWWTIEPDEVSATTGQMIPPGSSVVVFMDSWGVLHNFAFENRLTSLMTADSGGVPVEVYNESISGTTAAQQLANYDTNVLPHNPDYVIIDFAINDINQGLTPAQYQASLAALIQHIVDSGATPIVLGNLATASGGQTINIAGRWAEVMTNTSVITPNVQYDTTAPTIPGTPSTTTTNNKPTWTWAASTDSESGLADPAYTVEWSLDPSFLTGVHTATSPINSFTNSDALADDVWYFRVKATDADGNTSGFSGNGSFTVDTTGASITDISATPSSTTVVIMWDTSENTSSQVEYGLSNTYGSSTPETDTSPRVLNHSISISSLTACTSYHFRVSSTDSVGNQSISTDQVFDTNGCASPEPSTNPSSGENSTPPSSALSPAETPSCTDAVPVGIPDLFQINRSKTSAKLYFTPVNDNVGRYHVIFGLKNGDERFGSLSNPVVRESNNGVQSLTISDLNPKSEYWFKVAPVNGCAVGTWSNWMKTGKWKNKTSFFYRYFGLSL